MMKYRNISISIKIGVIYILSSSNPTLGFYAAEIEIWVSKNDN